MRIVLTGSGSGGHFYPLMAIAEALIEHARTERRIAPELYLMGPSPYDEGSLFKLGITYIHIPAGKVRRYFSFANILDGFKTVGGIFVALWKLFVLYPDVVMSKGSYTSMPVVIAATLLRIPIVVHESDVRPGRANKLAAKVAEAVAVSYEGSAAHFPKRTVVRTGIPVRTTLLKEISRDEAYATLGITPEAPLIVVLGGSQGAERINNLIITALDELLPQYTILHQTGEAHVQMVTDSAHALVKEQPRLSRYHIRGFLDAAGMNAAYDAASLVISRAGSTSIYEIALHGLPSILIPIPESISHDQRLNAYEYARTGAASVMEEKNLTPHLLVAEITRIMSDQALQRQMQEAAAGFAPRDAAAQLARILVDICASHERS